MYITPHQLVWMSVTHVTLAISTHRRHSLRMDGDRIPRRWRSIGVDDFRADYLLYPDTILAHPLGNIVHEWSAAAAGAVILLGHFWGFNHKQHNRWGCIRLNQKKMPLFVPGHPLLEEDQNNAHNIRRCPYVSKSAVGSELNTATDRVCRDFHMRRYVPKPLAMASRLSRCRRHIMPQDTRITQQRRAIRSQSGLRNGGFIRHPINS